MLRIHHAVLPSIFVFAMQVMPQTTTEPSVIPPDRSAEIYALYSAVIDHPRLSHSDTATKYLIEDSTGFRPDPSPAGCLTTSSAIDRASKRSWRRSPRTSRIRSALSASSRSQNHTKC
jgi:hypothetical protein